MEIYSNPVNYFVADFFGSPSMNLIAGEVVRDNGVARFRSVLFDIPLPERFKSVGAGKGTLGIRPEHVRINAGGKTDAALPVRLVEPLGKDTLLYFDAGTDRAFVAVSEGLSMADTQSRRTAHAFLGRTAHAPVRRPRAQHQSLVNRPHPRRGIHGLP